MKLSRRDFLKAGGASLGGLALLNISGMPALADSYRPIPLKKKLGEKTTICCYDGTGCGFIVSSDGERVINLEGDPDHPINRGAMCSKGGSLKQLNTVDSKLNPWRLTNVLYRKPGGTEWETKSWDWALDRIAQLVKASRDSTWVDTDDQGLKVNRNEGLACLGGSALDNEECYLLVKMMRALGSVYIEHHARL